MVRHLLSTGTIACLMLVVGCTSVQNKTEIASTLTAVYFNSIASRYMDRPTFIEHYEMSDGKSGILVQVAGYGNQYGKIPFSKANVADYIPLLDKYSDWQQKAYERQDSFSKIIGEAPNNFVTSGTLRFTFESGSTTNHYLQVLECSLGVCFTEQEITIDAKNVQHLKALLLRLDAGELKSLDVDSEYQ